MHSFSCNSDATDARRYYQVTSTVPPPVYYCTSTSQPPQEEAASGEETGIHPVSATHSAVPGVVVTRPLLMSELAIQVRRLFLIVKSLVYLLIGFDSFPANTQLLF